MSARPARARAAAPALLLLALGASAFAWRTVPSAYFVSDDFLYLFDIVNLPPLELLLAPHGGHVLAVRNAVFLLFARLFGTAPLPFYLAVLLTHLLNVALLFALLRRVVPPPAAAAFGALLFGTAPLLAATLTWYSVYGQVLATTAMLLVLLIAARAAARDGRLRRGETAAAAALLLAGAFSFGVGLGLALVAPLCLALLLPRRGTRRPPLLALWVAIPLLYVASHAAYDRVAQHPRVSGVAALTALAALMPAAWSQVLGMGVDLVGYGTARLLGGPLPLDYGAPRLWHGAALALTALSAWAAWRGGPTARRWLLALWLCLIGCYGSIAMGRFALWNALPAAVEQTRYHYAGAALLALLLAVAVVQLPAITAARLAFPLWLGAAALGFALWPPAVDTNAAARAEAALVIGQVRARVAAAPPGAAVRIPNRVFHAVGAPLVSLLEFPGWAAVFAIYFPANRVQGHPVTFVEPSAAVRAQFADGRRTAGLLVAPEDAPATP
ncbi:MAG: hypothetical protein SF182_23795 [Deltaproteobacteria bacterium]|nr:hypothetical protein [Deltaproteobacteria bacterium]